jgi:hypothetical protein
VRPQNGRGPPSIGARNDPQIEQPARTLSSEFNRRRLPSQDAAPALPRERLAYLARKIHALGDRPLLELFIELERGAPLIERLERYATLDGDFIQALNGDRLPSTKIVSGRRT